MVRIDWPFIFIVRVLTIDTLGGKVLRIRGPRFMVTTWWRNQRPHFRFMKLPKIYRRVTRKTENAS